MDYSYQKISYQSFLSMMFKWLFLGIGLTALTAIAVSFVIEGLYFIYFPVTIISSIIELVMVFILCKKLSNLSFESAKTYFIIYSIINGITMSFLFETIAPGFAVLAFLLTCALFGLLYTVTKYTDYNFISVGRICLMGIPVLIIGYIILLFVHAPVLYYWLLWLDLALFIGITLYDMKKVKNVYDNCSIEATASVSLICALDLYLDFINIFIDILSLISDNS